MLFVPPTRWLSVNIDSPITRRKNAVNSRRIPLRSRSEVSSYPVDITLWNLVLSRYYHTVKPRHISLRSRSDVSSYPVRITLWILVLPRWDHTVKSRLVTLKKKSVAHHLSVKYRPIAMIGTEHHAIPQRTNVFLSCFNLTLTFNMTLDLFEQDTNHKTLFVHGCVAESLPQMNGIVWKQI